MFVRRIPPRSLSRGKNASSVFYHLRDAGDRRLLFLTNTDYSAPASVKAAIRLPDRFAAALDDTNGKFTALPAKKIAGGLSLDLTLAPAESVMIALAPKAFPAPKAAPRGRARKVSLAGKWTVTRCDENSLTIDHVRLPHPARTWTGPQYVLFAAEELMKKGGNAHVRYEFDVDVLPKGPVHLALERPERWSVTVNNSPVPSRPRGYFVDTEFKRLDITASVRLGRNVVELEGRVTDDFELESIYIIGAFGVYQSEAGFRITAPATEVKAADLSGEGFSFFAGTLDIEKTVTLDRRPQSAVFALERSIPAPLSSLSTAAARGTCSILRYELAVSGLKKGDNRITLRLFGTLRNLLGPHHFEGPEIEWTSPGSFVNRKLWTDAYRFMPFGIKDAALIVR